MANRLATETSPYLLQHKDNPVDWRPWGEEAFARAAAEDKPILLSVGYAACHWCHVMEHESFEDEATAALMNEHFVPVKVDREERPDVDSIYMEAVQAMTGQGGWPMTVFLTPEGIPFYGGTYFPPDERHGLPSFGRVLTAVAETWRDRRGEVEEQGRRLADHIGAMARLEPTAGDVSEQTLATAFANLEAGFDPDLGGFGGAPKFPQPMVVDYLLRMHLRGQTAAGDMAARTLDAMAAGGMFDQLAGGFARYSVDRAWIVPHFEKMLYDNAQLLRTYARSFLVSGSHRHRRVAEMTADWMLTEMRDPRGGFWSSLDADSEGEEGKFYVFTLDEVRQAAGADAEAAIEHFGFSHEGNFEGRNIPVHTGPPADPEAIARARAALLELRSKRVRPGTDDKVLAGWNGLAAAALAEAGAALGRPEWIEAAAAAMRFVLDELRIEGRLMRAYRDGKVNHLGICEDYAFVAEACLELFEATFDRTWLHEATWACDRAIELFLDEDKGGFFTTGADAERMVVRPKDLVDNALPSGNSSLAMALQRLAAITGERRYEDHALAALKLVREAAERSPLGFGYALCAVDLYVSTTTEIVIVGRPDADDTDSLVEVVRSRYLPNKVLIVDRADRSDGIPLLEGRSEIEGHATAYVCRHGVCKMPVTDPAGLVEQLAHG